MNHLDEHEFLNFLTIQVHPRIIGSLKWDSCSFGEYEKLLTLGGD